MGCASYYKPFVRWIWAGGLMMALGGCCVCLILAIASASIRKKLRRGCMKRKVLLLPLIIFLAIARRCYGNWRVMLKETIRLIWNGAHWQASAEVSPRITGQSGEFYQADVLTQGKPVLLNVWAPGVRPAVRNINI